MNSPSAIWWYLLLPALSVVTLGGLVLAVGALCARSVARRADCGLAASRELPTSVLDDLSNPCLDPNTQSAQGCQPCTDDLAVIAALAVIAEALPAYRRGKR